MNKIILSLFITLLFAATASAQIVINPQVGVNLTSFNYNLGSAAGPEFTASASAGYQIGFVLRTGGGIAFIEPGFFLMGTGNKYVVTDGNNAAVTGTVGKTSLQVPVRVGIITGGGEGSFNMRLAAGPVIGYSLDTNDNPFNISEAELEDLSFAGKIGLGFDILIATIDLDYQFGLNDVFKDGAAFGFNTVVESGRNNTIMLTAGVKF